MSVFLKSFKRSIQIKFVFGICPFILNKSNTKVHSTHKTVIYTSFFILVAFAAYLYPFHIALKVFRVVENTSTYNSNLTIEHTLVLINFLVSATLSLKNRHRHKEVIESVSAIYDQVQSRLPTEDRCSNFTRLHITDMLYVFVHFCYPLTNLWFTPDRERVPIMVAFFVLLSFVLTNMLGIVVHIQDMMIIVSDSLSKQSDLCLDLTSDLSAETIQVLDQANDTMMKLRRCFGGHLLLIAMNDIMIITNMLLFNIRRVVFVEECYSLSELHFFTAFILPHLVKNLRLAFVCKRFDRSFSKLQNSILLKTFHLENNSKSIAGNFNDFVSVY